MLSRIADSLYWMSRYLERAGNTARLVEINLVHLLEAEDALPEAAQWRPLLSIGGSEEAYQARFDGAERLSPRAVAAAIADYSMALEQFDRVGRADGPIRMDNRGSV